MSVFARVRPIWPVITALASGALLAGAHAFQRFGGLAPCPLCLDQRNWHWFVLAASLASLVAARFWPGVLRLGAVLIGLLFVASFVQGAHHVAVEHGWIVAQCDARGIDLNDLTFDVNASVAPPSCDQIAWRMFGVSLAGYNAIISAVMALASFAVALGRKP